MPDGTPQSPPDMSQQPKQEKPKEEKPKRSVGEITVDITPAAFKIRTVRQLIAGTLVDIGDDGNCQITPYYEEVD